MVMIMILTQVGTGDTSNSTAIHLLPIQPLVRRRQIDRAAQFLQ